MKIKIITEKGVFEVDSAYFPSLVWKDWVVDDYSSWDVDYGVSDDEIGWISYISGDGKIKIAVNVFGDDDYAYYEDNVIMEIIDEDDNDYAHIHTYSDWQSLRGDAWASAGTRAIKELVDDYAGCRRHIADNNGIEDEIINLNQSEYYDTDGWEVEINDGDVRLLTGDRYDYVDVPIVDLARLSWTEIDNDYDYDDDDDDDGDDGDYSAYISGDGKLKVYLYHDGDDWMTKKVLYDGHDILCSYERGEKYSIWDSKRKNNVGNCFAQVYLTSLIDSLESP